MGVGKLRGIVSLIHISATISLGIKICYLWVTWRMKRFHLGISFKKGPPTPPLLSTLFRNHHQYALKHTAPQVFVWLTMKLTWVSFCLLEYIIASQCCLSFCCTMKWTSYMYTYTLSLLSFPPTPFAHNNLFTHLFDCIFSLVSILNILQFIP